MRQELLAPVAALVGYGELLTEEADRLELGQLAPDLGRILGAARDLLELVNRLLEEAAASDQPSRADLETIQAPRCGPISRPCSVNPRASWRAST